MKLSVRALAIASAILWGGSIFLVGLINMVSPSYGEAYLLLMASIYPGYTMSHTFGSVLVGTGYGIIDGMVAGAVFAWLYNLFVGQ